MPIKKQSPPPSDRQAEFLRFCSRALGTGRLHPMRVGDGAHIPGALLASLVDAFKMTDPPLNDVPARLVDESFDGPQWREPFMVYSIRNRVTGAMYIGRAKDGFVKRYFAGRWWEDHHNKRLMRDVELYGRLAFSVSLWPTSDETEMCRVEADMIRGHRLLTYNAKPEPAHTTR